MIDSSPITHGGGKVLAPTTPMRHANSPLHKTILKLFAVLADCKTCLVFEILRSQSFEKVLFFFSDA